MDLLRDDVIRVRTTRAPDEVGDLARWAAEALAQGAPLPAERSAQNPEGPCGLCGEEPAVVACAHCERPACRTHSWFMLGLCRECLTPQEVERAQRLRAARRPDLGVKWVEE